MLLILIYLGHSKELKEAKRMVEYLKVELSRIKKLNGDVVSNLKLKNDQKV
jgi:glycerol-3-phosphate cytidylyltransferase-like family protein